AMAAASLLKVLDIAKEAAVPTYYREQAYLMLSDIYYKQKEYRPSLEMLDEAVKLNPRNNARYYRMASFFISNSDLDAARIAIEKFIQNLPEAQRQNPLVKTMYAYLGNIYFLTDDPRTLLNLRMGSGTDNADCFTAQYIFYASTGREAEALPVLQKISAEYPKFVAPYVAIARISAAGGDEEKAYVNYLAAAQLLYKTDMPDSAIRYYLEALKIKPAEADIHLVLGNLYERRRNYSLSALHYFEYYRSKPDTEILLHLAYIYDLAQNKERSMEYIALSEKKDPSSSRLWFFKGVLSSRNEEYKDAERWLKKAIELKNDDHSYYYYLAAAQEKTGLYAEAIASLKTAIELDPENPSYHNFLGYLYADTNRDLSAAEELVEKALSQDPYNGAYLDSIGWV
ncbi:MAG: tetratricopeptide repeat protein, partial [Spirochaetota bacterium]